MESRARARTFATSTATALCIIPPRELWPKIDRLRSLYDKAYDTWPPHVNLVYPFVRPECVLEAAQIISNLNLSSEPEDIVTADLSESGSFDHKHRSILHLRPSPGTKNEALKQLASRLAEAIGRDGQKLGQLHMTIAQSDDINSDSSQFLSEKVRLLAPISWDVSELAILIRDDGQSSTSPGLCRMKLWGSLNIKSPSLNQLPAPTPFYAEGSSGGGTIEDTSMEQTAYHFDSSLSSWQPYSSSQDASEKPNRSGVDRLIVASYNVLAEFAWPPSSERHSKLVANIVSSRASADILVLQEVTDQFLTFLLADQSIRSRYQYSSHAPPNQIGVGPLPSLLNVVILSRFPLEWSRLAFHRKHKGAAVAIFPTITECGLPGASQLPLVVAACHLSQGLVDGAVVAKKTEVQRLLSHLAAEFEEHPCIIAGDFNLTTSSYSLDMARKRQDLSSQSYQYLRGFDSVLSEAGFQDAWVASRIMSGDSSGQTSRQQPSTELYEGEQGATFDPLTNELAAKLVGGGMNQRPQRYDRILVNNRMLLRPARFNMFGIPSDDLQQNSHTLAASDHWGIRSLLQCAASKVPDHSDTAQQLTVPFSKAVSSLGGLEDVKQCLNTKGCLPDSEAGELRNQAVEVLRDALQCQKLDQLDIDRRGGPRLLLTTVGSFSLGVWTPSSDMDCLCIGEISEKTFFSLAKSRLTKLSGEGISILRKVRANSGTMMELKVNDIKFDLQYCCAPSILEQFSEAMKRPSSDPLFALPPQTLAKLKPLRDVFYLLRSIPDLAQYRVAHLLLKEWAKSRGLYGAKFGLLGSIHISVLLVPVCKALAHDASSHTVADIIVSFFHHYAKFDWSQHAVFDPFYHGALSYHRSFREPLCLLGWHAPGLNTAPNASIPTARTIAAELKRADDLLSSKGITWVKFLGTDRANKGGNAADFIQAHRSFVRINVHYWGSSSAAGAKLVGWIESRCVMLLVDLDRKVPALAARIWPQRFTNNVNEGNSSSLEHEYHGCYLVGLDWLKNDDEARKTREQAKITQESLQSILSQFEMRMRGDERYFDPNTCWLSAEIVRHNQLESLELDDRYFGDHAMAEEDDSDDDDDELMTDEDEVDDGQSERPRHRDRKGRSTSTSAQAFVQGKFRTAVDVMNRLRWDPNLDSSDYIIGYEDRFIGTQEKRLELWKTEQTDEEFIPQHRIMFFKRHSDGVIVWERKTRIDDIFGSGVRPE